MKISVVVPCYNEEKNVPYIEKELFTVLNKIGLDYEVIFVDDGSTDNTFKKIQELIKKKKNIKLYKHDKNKGLGAGIKTAIKKCKGDITIVIDSDLTFSPKYIPAMIKKFRNNNIDCVVGSPHLAAMIKKYLTIGYF